MSWQRWDLHPSVIIGLALLGGLYVYLGGLRAPARRVASFAGALLVLSAVKFTLVVMFYMHLKADSRVFTFLFGAPLALAAVVMVALLFLLLGALTLRGAAGAG